ncbi:phosphinothricin acetyltransferase [Photobacterium aquae]|uniref:Phosphinothricin acetyltransferase n=1 Tax=Photobacterium aquae TaxID=1195763 RepID=A0A0J1GYT2_9GAMM|nr:GNAT family N-acetyltransferase [Photobacterium aquae]KLV04639.1 phosphinothricin acetyltransferase [Photobacterium aquae]
MRIRAVALNDADQITDIYNHYIRDTVITFEETPITNAEIAARIQKVTDAALPWLVAEHNGEILGYAYAAPYHVRSAFRFTVEPSVYLAPNATGRGIGKRLYQALIEQLAQTTIKNIIGVIALPNVPSVALHERLGFRKVGEFADVGFKFGQWISVGYWQYSFPEEKTA